METLLETVQMIHYGNGDNQRSSESNVGASDPTSEDNSYRPPPTPPPAYYPYLPSPGHINDGMQGSSGCTVCMFYSYAINTILKDKVNVNISINLNAK